MKKAVLKGLAAALVMAVAGLWSCSQPDGGTDKTNTLELSSTADAVFTATVTESVFIEVTTDASGWDAEVTVGEEWINVYVLDNELEIRPRNNSTANQRVGRITFTAGNASPVHVMVVQAAPEVDEDVLEVDPTETITFQQKSNRDVVLTVMTNVSEGYDVDAPEWVVLTKGEETLTVNVTNNTTDATRSGRLTITAGDAEPVYVTVVQHNYVEQSESTTGHLESESGTTAVTLTLQDTEEEQHDVYTGTIKVSLDTATDDDVTFTLAIDEEYLNEYNFNHGTNYQLYPSELVSFTNGQEVTIPAGEMEAEVEFTMTVNDKSLLYNDRYLLSFTAENLSDNMQLAYADSYVTYVLTKRMEKKVRNVVMFEVNDTNPLNALEYRLPDGQNFFDVVVLFAANINWSNDRQVVYLNNNPNVQALLNETETYIQPLRERGMRVDLGLLGNHDASGICRLTTFGNQMFGRELAEACLKYKLDGICVDDEYTEGSMNNDWILPSSSSKAGSELLYYTKQALDELCPWETAVSFFAYGSLYNAVAVEGHDPGEFIGYKVPNYGSRATPDAGMTLQNCAYQSNECHEGNMSTTESSARAAKSGGYGWIMWFAWDPNPESGIYRDRDSYFKNAARGLYDQELVSPTGYYKKKGEGVFDPVRYTR